jgi:hypothetical protein
MRRNLIALGLENQGGDIGALILPAAEKFENRASTLN